MKKETRIFLIILIGWLVLLDFSILKTVAEKYSKNYGAIVVKNLVSGAAVYYPNNTESMFQAVIVPMVIFNILIIIFLGLGYYFWKKSKTNLQISKNSLSRKAQAAMEFMMTYGWAIMALVISIAALSYFGVVNFSPTGNAICALSPGFTCEEFIVGKGGVVMVIRNNLGVDINSVNVNITNSIQGPCLQSVPSKILNNGEKEDFFVACSNIQSLNEKFIGDIVIKYKKADSQLERIANGLLKGSVINYSYNDTDNPHITILEPTEGKIYNSLLYNLRYNVEDSNPTVCNYKLDSQDFITIPDCTNLYSLNSSIPGQHTLTLYVYDTKNNSATETINFVTSEQVNGTGSPNFFIFNITARQFKCMSENPPITFRVINNGTGIGIPIIDYIINDIFNTSFISPNNISIEPEQYLDFQLNVGYNYQATNNWNGSITVNPGSSKGYFNTSCQ